MPPSHGPRFADVQPDRHQQRNRKRRAGVRKRRSDVHVEENRCAQPDGKSGTECARSDEAAGRRDPENDGDESIERRAVRDGRDIRARIAVDRHVASGRTCCARYAVADSVERRPQDGAADRPVIDPPPGRRRQLEERLVKITRLGDVVIVEVLIFVLERHVVIEPERPADRRNIRLRPTRYSRAVTAGSEQANSRSSVPSSRGESIR